MGASLRWVLKILRQRLRGTRVQHWSCCGHDFLHATCSRTPKDGLHVLAVKLLPPLAHTCMAAVPMLAILLSCSRVVSCIQGALRAMQHRHFTSGEVTDALQ